MISYVGIELPFTRKENEGSYPGEGSAFEQWTCDWCGYVYTKQMYGIFASHEPMPKFEDAYKDLIFHFEHCPKRPGKIEPCPCGRPHVG